MPLNTQIIRDGEPLQIRWGGFHIAAMVVAAAMDSGEGPWPDNSRAGIVGDDTGPDVPIGISPREVFDLASYPVIGATPLGHDAYTLREGYTFLDKSDGEIFTFEPGDQLVAFRN